VDTAEKIKVMQAYLDGKTIICEGPGLYRTELNINDDVEISPSWNWQSKKYSVKTEPRTYWMAIFKMTSAEITCHYKEELDAICSRIDGFPPPEVIKVQEVI
jgi:hypothetical protein